MQQGSGKWEVLYILERLPKGMQPVARQPKSPELVELETESTSKVLDFQLIKIDGSIIGTVVDDEGNAVTEGVYVWIERVDGKEKFSREIEVKEGAFETEAPMGAEFVVGAYLPPTLREKGYLEPKAQVQTLMKVDTAKVQLTLGRKKDDQFVSGKVKSAEGSPLANAYVYAWSPSGQAVEGASDENGSFRLSVISGNHWFVGADHVDEDSGRILATRKDQKINLTKDASKTDVELVLQEPEFKLPNGIVETFDPEKDFKTVLPDGTEIFIPANAVEAPEGTEEVRLLAEPIAGGLSRSLNEKPLDYGYSIEITDLDGKEIGHSFNKDVRISIAFDESDLQRADTKKDQLSLSFFSTDKDAWENADATVSEGRIHAKVDHFSQWAATAPSAIPSTNPLAQGLVDVDQANGWYLTNWLGYIHDAGNGWVYHPDHGWLFPTDDGAGNYWLYLENLGWTWSGPAFYGNEQGNCFLYSDSLKSWLHYNKDAGNFYIYQGNGYLMDDKGSPISVEEETPEDTTEASKSTPSGSGNYSKDGVLTGTGWGYTR